MQNLSDTDKYARRCLFGSYAAIVVTAVIISRVVFVSFEEGVNLALIEVSRLLWLQAMFCSPITYMMRYLHPEIMPRNKLYLFVFTGAGICSFVFFVTTF